MRRLNIVRRLNSLSLSTRIGIVVLFMIIGTAILVMVVLYRYESEKILSAYAAQEEFRLNINANLIQQSVDSLRRDVIFLAHTPPIQGIVRATKSRGYDIPGKSSLQTWKRRMRRIFIEFSKTRPLYFQIRYIGIADKGKELVRVDSSNGHSRVTPEDKLQSKSDRGYYKAILKLRAGEVYLSPINLNREWGEIQVPHIRTLRAGTPIYSSDGKLFGMVVINLNMGIVLNEVKDSSLNYVSTYLVNSDGDFLVNPNPRLTFGFDLGQRHRWQDEFPGINLYKISSVNREYSQDNIRSMFGGVDVMARRIELIKNDPGKYITLVYVIPKSKIEERIIGASKNALAVVLVIAIMIAIIVRFLMGRMFAPMNKITYAAHEIGGGDYNVELPNSKYGEIATLTRAFGTMLEGIREREEQAAELNARLNASKKQANLIIDAAPEAIIVVNQSGDIARLNDSALKLFGYSRQELIGKPVEVLVPARFRTEHVNYRDGFIGNPSRRMMGEGRDLYAMCKDGTELPVEVGISPINIDDEILVIAVLSDITQRKHAQRILQNINSELEQRVEERTRQLAVSNKELEQFAYVASHDLQEPLRMVASYLQLIERRYKKNLDDDAIEFIGYAVDGANRMKNMINGLLEYSRVQTRTRDFEVIDMELILNNVMQDLQVQIEERKALITHDKLPCVMGDASQIQRLLQNLIANAMKYCEREAPRIHVSVESLEQTSLELPEGTPKCGWIFSVSDNGIGIDNQYLDRVFQLFQRLHTRQEYPGTGLGLSLCKRIIERHGGNIWVRSMLDRGSTFYFVMEKLGDDKDPGMDGPVH